MKILKVLLLIVSPGFLLYCCVETSKPVVTKTLTYTGTGKCQVCHPKEYDSYKSSDHYHAMDTALPRSVKGDFNNSTFVYFGDTTFFYQQDGRYYVRTTDSLRRKTEFQISFTFGWQPLQQYLVRFNDGRIQTLPFCWDTRPKEKGGQRWFHIYGMEKILPDDELFWTGINQNWNNMCADCHTTDYFKNFDIDRNTFHSSWKEDKVSCESCHGPASGHLQWADKKDESEKLKGFIINLSAKKVNWKFSNDKGIAYPDSIEKNEVLIETCARCHSRASRMTDNYQHGQSLLQTHLPSSISTANYFIDGQIKEEDYEYGSFLQSKMYAQGVTCINCHDPHSMKVKASGNTLCASCHTPEKYAAEKHTFHPVNSTGSQCVNCHMPVTTYMGIDGRRDHSIRIPRPDHSKLNSAPNACNKCHANKTVDWSVQYFMQWYGDKLPKAKTYGELLYTISKNTEGSEAALNELLSSQNYPAIIQATALEQYTQFFSPRITESTKKYLKSNDPNLRLNALHAVAGFTADEILPLVKPMLNDDVLAVRMEAMNLLTPMYTQLDNIYRQRFDAVMNEYLGIQRKVGDRPEGYLNQGILLSATGNIAGAEQIYLLGLKRFPKFIALYANMADHYRAAGGETKAKEYIEKGLAVEPNNPTLHYSSAMWYYRNQDKAGGLSELKKAIQLNPKDPSYIYAYAIAMYSDGESKTAIQSLEMFVTKNGNDPLIINGLISLYQDLKQSNKVDFYLNKRKAVFGF